MIDRIDHIVLNCRNVEATASWYERALGFRRESHSSPAAPGQRIGLKFGQHKFNLRQTGDANWWTCKVDAPGSLDLCFVAEGSLKPVIARLAVAGFPIVADPASRSGALGPMTSIYCEDPDGNLVKVSTYAGDPVKRGACNAG
jgi:catechol 2,3-dioxygenase-like lactoylglutathione lyase family enzyme